MYIIPHPQKWELHKGSYVLSYQSKILLDPQWSEHALRHAFYLQKEVLSETGLDLMVTKGKSRFAAFILQRDTSLKKEEYTIQICQTGIFITAGAEHGLLHGIQTMIQILRQTGACLPLMSLYDHPEIADRGFYYDATRSRVPTLDYLKKLVDKLSFYKLNQLQIYIEHTYLFEDFSELWRDDTPLTSQEILELDAYCQERHVELVPSIASFGHLYKLLRTKSYRHLCEKPELCDDAFSFVDRMEHHTLNVSDDQSIQLSKQLISEYASLFSSDKFNICGDETFDLGQGQSKHLADSLGIQNIYTSFIKELCDFILEKGKIPLFWGDIICKFPEAIQMLPKETICLNWGYSECITDDSIQKLAKAGAIQYCCPGVRGWNQLVNEIANSYENIKRMCTYAITHKAIGILNTDWGDFGHINHPDFSVVGMIYGAAFSWNKNIPELQDINKQISRIEFEDKSEQIVEILAEISPNWIYDWFQLVKFKERKEIEFTMEQLIKVPGATDNLHTIKHKLINTLPYMDSRTRGCIPAYLLAIDGMLLFHRIGLVIAQQDVPDSEKKTSDNQKLAAELEEWFYYYKKEWRKVSKESELYQVQEVILWYADLLRD